MIQVTELTELRQHSIAGNGSPLAKPRHDERFLAGTFPCRIGEAPASPDVIAGLVFQRFNGGHLSAIRTVKLAPNLGIDENPIVLSWRVVDTTVVELPATTSGSGTGSITEALVPQGPDSWVHFTPGTGPAPAPLT